MPAYVTIAGLSENMLNDGCPASEPLTSTQTQCWLVAQTTGKQPSILSLSLSMILVCLGICRLYALAQNITSNTTPACPVLSHECYRHAQNDSTIA